MPKVSVVIPIYNMEQYLEECVKSVLSQDYENYEMILVNDGSTDASYDIAIQLAALDDRIIVINKENEGVSVARNVGIDCANGEWIMFIDPDDTLQPNLISSLLTQVNEGTDIVACCCTAFDDQLKEADYFFVTDRSFSSFTEKKDLYKQLLDSHYGQPGIAYTAIGVPWGKLYRRDFLNKQYLRFNPRLKRYQDNLFNMYAFFYARTVCYLNQPLYNYRLDHIQKFGKEYRPKYHVYMGDLCEERYICMKQLRLLDDAELREFYCTEMQNHLWSIMKNDIFSPENPMPYKTKKMQAKKLEGRGCFEIFFQKAPNSFSLKNRLKWHLLKGEHYHMISIMIWIRRVGRKQNQ